MAFTTVSSFTSSDSGYDSGIVEVFDEPPPRVMNTQSLAKDLARQRQQMLAGELSRLDAEEYQQDILEHMLRMDVSSSSILICLHIMLIELRPRPYLMSIQLTFRPRFNGS